MVVLLALISGFILTILIEVYLSKTSIGIVMLSAIGLIGLMASLCMSFGIYFIIVPNDVKFLDEYTLKTTFWGFHWKFAKKENISQKELFKIMRKRYLKIQVIFLITVILIIGFIVYIIILITITGILGITLESKFWI